MLNPSKSHVFSDPKLVKFARQKRPELFPVKEEHRSTPCSYLDSTFTLLNKKCMATKVSKKREFQEESKRNPGPSDYNHLSDQLPVKPNGHRPLTSKKSFNKITTISREKKLTIFSGNNTRYDEGLDQTLSKIGNRIGPGPSAVNTRECSHDRQKTFHCGLSVIPQGQRFTEYPDENN